MSKNIWQISNLQCFYDYDFWYALSYTLIILYQWVAFAWLYAFWKLYCLVFNSFRVIVDLVG